MAKSVDVLVTTQISSQLAALVPYTKVKLGTLLASYIYYLQVSDNRFSTAILSYVLASYTAGHPVCLWRFTIFQKVMCSGLGMEIATAWPSLVNIKCGMWYSKLVGFIYPLRSFNYPISIPTGIW